MGVLALPGWVEDTNTILGIVGFFLSIVLFVLGLRVFATRAVKDVLREMEQHPEVHSPRSVELIRQKLLPKTVSRRQRPHVPLRHRLWVQGLIATSSRVAGMIVLLAILVAYYAIGFGATALLDVVWPPSQASTLAAEVTRAVAAPTSFTLISVIAALFLRGENKSATGFVGYQALAVVVLVLIARGETILAWLGRMFEGWI